jgi:hypothetical protein
MGEYSDLSYWGSSHAQIEITIEGDDSSDSVGSAELNLQDKLQQVKDAPF